MDNNYGGDDRENFNAEAENGEPENGRGDGEDFEKKKPWFLTPSVTVSKEYNSYRSGESVFEETVRENEGAFRGAVQLENEDPVTFYHRRRWEWGFARVQAKKRLGKSSKYTAAILLADLFFGNFFAICLYFAFSNDVVEVTATLLQYLLVAPMIIILANIGQKHKLFTFFKKPNASWFYVFKWSVIALGMTYAVSILSGMLFDFVQVLGVNVNDLSQPVPDTPGRLILEFFAVVIGAPIFEELLFRGVLLTHHIKYGCWHAIIVTGVLFGVFHQNHHQMFYAAAIGIIFGYIDVKAGSIIPSLVAHITINLYSFLMTLSLYFTNYNETIADPTVSLDGAPIAMLILGILNVIIYALIIVSVIMFACEIKKNKSDFQLPKGDSFLTEREKASAFFSHPLMIVLLVLLAISTYTISFLPPTILTA